MMMTIMMMMMMNDECNSGNGHGGPNQSTVDIKIYYRFPRKYYFVEYFAVVLSSS